MSDLDIVRRSNEQGTRLRIEACVNEKKYANAFETSFHEDGVHGKRIKALYSTEHVKGMHTGRDPPVLFALVSFNGENPGVSTAFRWCDQAQRFVYDAGDIRYKLKIQQ
jgi:hypothetical protein